MKIPELACTPRTVRRAGGRAVSALKLLANENRLLLLSQLSQGEMCVSELESRLHLHQPTLSQQLCVLRSEGAVRTRRQGTSIYYSVADPKLVRVLGFVCGLYKLASKP